jgi:hypothetical protein
MTLRELILSIIQAGGDFDNELFAYVDQSKYSITDIHYNKDGWLLETPDPED